MVARGECVAKRSTLPLDHPKKRGSPERAEDTLARPISVGLSGLKRYPTSSRGYASLAPGYLISAPSALTSHSPRRTAHAHNSRRTAHVAQLTSHSSRRTVLTSHLTQSREDQ